MSQDWWFVGFLVFWVVWLLIDRRGLNQRLRVLEAAHEKLAMHAGLDSSIDRSLPSDEVKRLARAGKTIAAIKLYREQSGAGLMQSKEVVERCTNAG